MFELVAPWNRIVVFYPKDEFILTGVIHTLSGEDYSYAWIREYGNKVGLKTVDYEVRPASDVDLSDPNIVNQEGYVARYSNGFRVKLKYDQYMMLHKIMTTWSVKGIWEALSQGKDVDLTGLPEEFRVWFDKNKTTMHDRVRDIEYRAKAVFEKAPVNASRKEYAAYFTQFPDVSAILFRMLDKRLYADIVWRMVKPSNAKTFFQEQGVEDVT